MVEKHLSWFGIVRLGLVQTALGAIVVLSTSTVNRLMIVELALPALICGSTVPAEANTIWIWPPIRSTSTGPPPFCLRQAIS